MITIYKIWKKTQFSRSIGETYDYGLSIPLDYNPIYHVWIHLVSKA